MGCDIHIFIEYKIGNKPWEADKRHSVEIDGDENDENAFRSVKEVQIGGRNYKLFSLLAGVRGVGPRAKGLPHDVSDIVAKAAEYYGRDGHSHSYSSLKEFENAVKSCLLNQERYDYINKINLPILNKKEINHFIKTTKPFAFNDFLGSIHIDRWLEYPSLLAYCKQQIQLKKSELEVEKHLLGVKGSIKVECRLVYYFDN